MAELAHSTVATPVTHYHHQFTFSPADEENENQSCAMSELSVVARGAEPLVGSYELVIIFMSLIMRKLGVEFQLSTSKSFLN